MARQRLALSHVGRSGWVPGPDAQHVVAAARDEATVGGRTGRGVAADQATGRGGRCPRDAVDAEAMGRERGVLKAIVLELEDADSAVRGGTGKQAACLVRRPRNEVD